jgi:DNA-binding NtrC family response regulator
MPRARSNDVFNQSQFKAHDMSGIHDDADVLIPVHVGESLADVERRLIEQTLQYCRTREQAARILQISTKTLYNKLRQYESESATGAHGASLPRADVAVIDGQQRH